MFFFSVCSHHKCLRQLFSLHLNTYGHYKYSRSFSTGIDFRQILTSKVSPRPERGDLLFIYVFIKFIYTGCIHISKNSLFIHSNMSCYWDVESASLQS